MTTTETTTLKIETFECDEVSHEPAEIADECVQIIKDLGLSGQEKLCKRNEQTESEQRCPYRKMLKEEMDVYKLLCPDATSVEKYDASPLPYRVLQVVQHAKSIGIFDRIMVWDKANADIKDPVLVGEIGDSFSSRKETYILARWGEELDEWPALRRKAADAAKEKMRGAAMSIAAACKRYLSALEDVESSRLIGANVPVSFHLEDAYLD